MPTSPKRTLATDAKAGVSFSICHDLPEIDVLPAAMNSNPLYIEISPLPQLHTSALSIVNSNTISNSRDEHIESTLDHDKRDVFI